MEQRRKEEDEIAAATGSDPKSDKAIMEEILGHRSGYRRGFGYGMPIEPQHVCYYEEPRDETLSHSEYDRTAQQQQMDKMQEQINLLMSYVRPPPMSSHGQCPPYQQAAPHMGTYSSGPDSSQPSFAPFTPAAPHTYPTFHGMPSQPPTYPHGPPDPDHGPSGSSGRQRAQPPSSGFAPWSAGTGFGQYTSQTAPFGSSRFPGSHPAAGPSASQCPPHTPPPPSVYHPTPPTTSPSTMSQTTTVRGSSRVRQRQHQGR